jgi:hypothetical protein
MKTEGVTKRSMYASVDVEPGYSPLNKTYGVSEQTDATSSSTTQQTDATVK